MLSSRIGGPRQEPFVAAQPPDERTPSLLKFSLFCILATGFVVTLFYLTDQKAKVEEVAECIKEFVGDGFCDDSMNLASCEYDNGDCCLPTIDKSNCLECWCFATGGIHVALTEGCKYSSMGDGFCDGSNNRPQCSFDSGDCCLAVVKKIVALASNAGARRLAKFIHE